VSERNRTFCRRRSTLEEAIVLEGFAAAEGNRLDAVSGAVRRRSQPVHSGVQCVAALGGAVVVAKPARLGASGSSPSMEMRSRFRVGVAIAVLGPPAHCFRRMVASKGSGYYGW